MFMIINENNYSELKDILSLNGWKDVFFTPEYLKINQHIYGGEMEYYVFSDAHGEVVYPYIKRPIPQTEYLDITSPYGFGGFLFKKDNDLSNFNTSFMKYCSERNIISEFIRFHPFYQNHKLKNNAQLQIERNKQTVIFDFSKQNNEPSAIVKKEVLKKVKKASRNDIEIILDAKWEYLNHFTELYQSTMENKNASDFYLFDRTFFGKFYEELRDKAVLLIAHAHHKIIGGLLLIYGGSFAYNFLSCSDPDYLRFGVNDALQYFAIKWAHKEGFKALMLGGGVSEGDTLYRYKEKFSPARLNFFIGKRILSTERYRVLCEKKRLDENLDESEFYSRAWFPLYRS